VVSKCGCDRFTTLFLGQIFSVTCILSILDAPVGLQWVYIERDVDVSHAPMRPNLCSIFASALV